MDLHLLVDNQFFHLWRVHLHWYLYPEYHHCYHHKSTSGYHLLAFQVERYFRHLVKVLRLVDDDTFHRNPDLRKSHPQGRQQAIRCLLEKRPRNLFQWYDYHHRFVL